MSIKIKDKKIFLRLIIILLSISACLLMLYVGILVIKYKNYHLNMQINLLLSDSSIEEKEDYINKLTNDINNYELTISKYNTKEIDQEIQTITNNNDNLSQNIKKKEEELNKKKTEYSSLYNRYRELTNVIIPNVITYNQYSNYPNGCEAVALYILLKYYNVNVSVEEVMNSLPIGRTPYIINGTLRGGDPNYAFLGNPRGMDGWGIYDIGLAVTANKIKSGIINGTGMDFNKIYDLIREGRPVIVWTSIDLKDPYVYPSWISDTTGKTIYWKNYNHALVVIGFNDDSIIVSDPINGQIRYFNKQKFIMIYEFMGRRALYY